MSTGSCWASRPPPPRDGAYVGHGAPCMMCVRATLTLGVREAPSVSTHRRLGPRNPPTKSNPIQSRSSTVPVARVHEGMLFRWTAFVENLFYSVAQE